MTSANLAVPDPTHALRRSFGAFPTGVTVITTRLPDGQVVALTCSSFNTVSLAPPLVSWSVMRTSARAPAFLQASHFAISVLGAGHETLARAFARSAEEGLRLSSHYPAPSGSPLIAGSAAVFDCSVHSTHELGDHHMLVGLVSSHQDFDIPALTFSRGAFGQLASRADGTS